MEYMQTLEGTVILLHPRLDFYSDLVSRLSSTQKSVSNLVELLRNVKNKRSLISITNAIEDRRDNIKKIVYGLKNTDDNECVYLVRFSEKLRYPSIYLVPESVGRSLANVWKKTKSVVLLSGTLRDVHGGYDTIQGVLGIKMLKDISVITRTFSGYSKNIQVHVYATLFYKISPAALPTGLTSCLYISMFEYKNVNSC